MKSLLLSVFLVVFFVFGDVESINFPHGRHKRQFGGFGGFPGGWQNMNNFGAFNTNRWSKGSVGEIQGPSSAHKRIVMDQSMVQGGHARWANAAQGNQAAAKWGKGFNMGNMGGFGGFPGGGFGGNPMQMMQMLGR